MNDKRRKAILYVTTALGLGLGLLAPQAVQAETAPAQAAQSETVLPDVIVTARRIQERLQDVPISVTVYNQEQLTNRNIVNAGDLATYTPSLTANSRFGAENTSFAIRGFVQDPSTPPSVAVYFADVAALRAAGGTTLGNGAGPGAYFDLQNVQVLKGPQGTLFGRNTTGGAVLLVPQKPTSQFGGYAEGTVGNYDLRRLQAVVNVPLSDKYRLRLGYDTQTRDGYLQNTTNVGPKDFADVNYWAARISFVADLTPNLENYLVATKSESDTNGYLPQVFVCAPALGAVGSPLRTSANLGCDQVARQQAGGFYNVENATVAPRQHIRQWQVINTTTWKASDNLTIKNIASYGEFREYFRSSVYGENLIITPSTPVNPAFGATNPNVGQSLRRVITSPAPGMDNAAESTVTEELQFQGSNFGERLIWQGGGYLELSDPLGFSGAYGPSSALCPDTVALHCRNSGVAGFTPVVTGRVNKQWFRDYAVYGQATYKLTDQFSVTGGLRYTWDETNTHTRNINYVVLPTDANPPLGICSGTRGPFVAEAACDVTYRQKASKPTWVVDLDYKPTDDVLVYTKYARGYRAGGLKTDGGAFVSFDPEKVDTYEVGLKTSFRGAMPGTFNVAGFYNDFTNEQLAARLDPTPTNPNQTPPQIIANAGKSRIWGFEAEATVRPFHGLQLEGSYAYLNTKLKSIPPAAGASTVDYFPPIATGARVGAPLSYTPKNKFTVTATYTLPVDERLGKMSVGATFSHQDKMITTASYEIAVASNNPLIPAQVLGKDYGTIPSIDLLNLNFNWNSVGGQPIDLAVFVTNATNEKYVAAVFGGIGAFGFDARALGEPRMFGVRAKYHFGG